MRLLGRGKTLEQAITELFAIPAGDNRRSQTLRLLTNWRVSLQLKNPQEEEERELMATLSQAYLDWEQPTEQRGEQRGIVAGERSLLLRQLTRPLGDLPPVLQAQFQLEALPLEQLENLGQALLDFQSLSDLEKWLQND